METTEKIVEAYVRYVQGWATIPNIKCKGQFEIDLIAFDPKTFERYHIESGVSISKSYSKLSAKPFSENDLKIRIKTAAQRRTIGYFVQRKFGSKEVIERLSEYGLENGNYSKIIVSWGWEDDAKREADRNNIILWDFRLILREIGHLFKMQNIYFIDDTLRTLQLFAKAIEDKS